jgi:Pyridine nucleotide-disulphide oxidoreductase
MLTTAIVGAGPYGLSIAAHLRRNGIPFRIFGRPMDSWRSHMPKGMMLKSDGFASNLDGPGGEFTLKEYCAERGIPYSDTEIPVSLATFSSYGVAFQERMVPELEDRYVQRINRLPEGFSLLLDNGETLRARHVILAVGITHFEYVPENLRHLPAEFCSHSFAHHHLEPFKGRHITVIGGGASALGMAGLLRDVDCDSHLVARGSKVTFHSGPDGSVPSLWQSIRHPRSGLGPGLRSRFYADAPMAFRYLPEKLRVKIVRTALGPSGGWTTRDKVIGRVPLFLGRTIERAEIKDGKVLLHMLGKDGSRSELVTEHVIAGTGFRVDLDRLQFLAPEIRAEIKSVQRTPILSSTFESSVAGLHFVGVAAANSFGPVMRFAFGARFAAERLAALLKKSESRSRVSVPVAEPATLAK